MDSMDEAELFTVNVFQSRDRTSNESVKEDFQSMDLDSTPMKPIAEFQNMVSARIIKGRMLELEHSNLAGPLIKFKTVINYEKSLKPNSLIGLTFKSQDGYMKRDDDDD